MFLHYKNNMLRKLISPRTKKSIPVFRDITISPVSNFISKIVLGSFSSILMRSWWTQNSWYSHWSKENRQTYHTDLVWFKLSDCLWCLPAYSFGCQNLVIRDACTKLIEMSAASAAGINWMPVYGLTRCLHSANIINVVKRCHSNKK